MEYFSLPDFLETYSKENAHPIRFSAVHSGKLGDIVYALPTCKKLGINHLILNACESHQDSLRNMPLRATKQMIPLLLEQSYIDHVSLVEVSTPLENYWNNIQGVDFNFDAYRNIAKHRLLSEYPTANTLVKHWSYLNKPVHLSQMFSESQGIFVDISSPWLSAPSSQRAKGGVVFSLTYNWRTYPEWYWKLLLKDLDDLYFVGTESEFNRCPILNAQYLPTTNHLELASIIKGAKCFLGTISYPYAIAEALKVNRLVEICDWNLNAFPLGKKGEVLPVNPLKGRELLSNVLHLEKDSAYNQETLRLERNLFWKSKISTLSLQLESRNTWKRSLEKVRYQVRNSKNRLQRWIKPPEAL